MIVTASVAPMRAPTSPGSATCVTSLSCGTGFALGATGAMTGFAAFALTQGLLVVLTWPALQAGVAVGAAVAARHPVSAMRNTSASACRSLIPTNGTNLHLVFTI